MVGSPRFGGIVWLVALGGVMSAGCTQVQPGSELPGPGPDGVDADGDGHGANVDCDDQNPDIHPGAPEICGDGIDNNCDDGIDNTRQCLDACGYAAENNSYLGCEYLALDLPQFNTDKIFAISVSNPSPTQMAHLTIETPAGTVYETDVAPRTVETYQVTNRDSMNLPSAGIWDRTYVVTTDQPVAAYQFNSFDTENAASTDASLLFPTHALADRYYSMDYDSFNTNDSFIAVVAIEDGTTVDVTPPGGATTSSTLQRHEVLVVTGTASGATLAGSAVDATANVAVFGGNRCAQVPAGTLYCDHLEQQIFPRQAIGTHYVVGRSADRATCSVPDRIRVLADKNGTSVTINPAIAGPFTLNAGEWVEFAASESFELSASEAVLVGHFLRSSGSSECSNEGDPAFTLQVPTDQFRADYLVLTPPTYQSDYLLVIAPPSASVTIDGQPATLSTATIGSSGFSRTQIEVEDGPHIVEASEPIGVIVNGYDYNVSYAYPGGLDLEVINPIE